MVRVRLGKDADWYEYDGDTLTVREARELKKLTGMGLKEYANGTASADVDALCFMFYIAQRRAGVAVQWHDLDDVNIADLQIQDDPPPGTGTNGVATLHPPRGKGKKAATG